VSRRQGETKSVLIATRVTPRIRDYAVQLAAREGLSTSEWLRLIVLSEIKKTNSLTSVLYDPR
jgi:hypothetical protein